MSSEVLIFFEGHEGALPIYEALEEKRNTLLTELDTQIKVSNATTFIEVA